MAAGLVVGVWKRTIGHKCAYLHKSKELHPTVALRAPGLNRLRAGIVIFISE
jgi:hypothetical protein